jgi:hypothetical protein
MYVLHMPEPPPPSSNPQPHAKCSTFSKMFAKFDRFGINNVRYVCKFGYYGMILFMYSAKYGILHHEVESKIIPVLKHFTMRMLEVK